MAKINDGKRKVNSVAIAIGKNGGAVAKEQEIRKQSKNCPERRSKRVIRTKRKLDFVYTNDREENKDEIHDNSNQIGSNNNAQLTHAHVSNLGQSQCKMRKHGVKSRTNKSQLSKKEKKQTSKISHKRLMHDVFDGIKVAVNSDDEEELDYDDILEDEDSSMYQDQHDQQEGAPVPDQQNENMDCGQNAGVTSVNNSLDLGASADEQTIMNNPHLRKLLNKMLDERIQEAQSRGESSGSQLLTRMTPPSAIAADANQASGQKSSGKKNKNQGNTMVKSPSDTTIYVPALTWGHGNQRNQPELFISNGVIQLCSKPNDNNISNRLWKGTVVQK